MEHVRDNSRADVQGVRQDCRDLMRNKYRELADSQATEIETEQQMKKYAHMLTTKRLVTPQLLVTINNGLLNNEKLIAAFMEDTAALSALIRLFSVSQGDVRHQILAAHCLCNISLGHQVHCLRLAKMVGSFLVMKMSGMNSLLREASARTVGNLSRFKNVCDYLKCQGAYAQVTKLLDASDENVRRAAVYCLTHSLTSSSSIFNEEDYLNIASAAVKNSMDSSVLFLLYLTSHNTAAATFLAGKNVHTDALMLLNKTIVEEAGEDVSLVLTLVRFLGNLSAEGSGTVSTNLLHTHTLQPTCLLLLASQHPAVVKETMWLLANLLHHPLLQVQALCREVGLLASLQAMPKQLPAGVS